MTQITISSLFGKLTIFELQDKIVCLKWGPRQNGPSNAQPTKVLLEAANQLKAYFAKELKNLIYRYHHPEPNFKERCLVKC